MEVLPPGSFGDQILRPWGQKDTKTQAAAWAKTIIVGIFSIGIVQLGFGLYALWLRGRRIKPLEPGASKEETVVAKVAQDLLSGESAEGSPHTPHHDGTEGAGAIERKGNVLIEPPIEERRRDLGREGVSQGAPPEVRKLSVEEGPEDKEKPEVTPQEERPAEVMRGEGRLFAAGAEIGSTGVSRSVQGEREEETPEGGAERLQKPAEVDKSPKEALREGGEDLKEKDLEAPPPEVRHPEIEREPEVTPQEERPAEVKLEREPTAVSREERGEREQETPEEGAEAPQKPAAWPFEHLKPLMPRKSVAVSVQRQPPAAKALVEPEIVQVAPPPKSFGPRAVNTAWFLGGTFNEEDERAFTAVADEMFQSSCSSTRLSDSDWLTGLRAYTVLSRGKGAVPPEKNEQIFSFLIRYFLTHGCSQNMPREFCELYEFLKKDRQDLDKVFAFFSSEFKPSRVGKDPNAVRAFNQLMEESLVSDWRAAALSLEGVTELRPWPSSGGTDRHAMLSLLQELGKQTPEAWAKGQSLRNVCLALLFVLSAHTLNAHEWGQCKKAFLRIKPSLDVLRRLLRDNPPSTEQDKVAARDFLRLYFLLKGSIFDKRLLEDVPGQSMIPNGNLSVNFTVPDLTRSLNEARVWYASQEDSLRAPTIAFNEERIPSQPLPERGLEGWRQVFYESAVGDVAATWEARQKKALQEMQAIEQSFQQGAVPIDFQALVAAIQNGDRSAELYLKQFADGGLVFLRDYVYPYSVLQKVVSTEAGATETKFLSGAASPIEICELGGKESGAQVTVLKNVLRLMRSPGGSLAKSAIHSSQIDMLRSMISSIQRGKSVYICNETGTGKTTMARLAPQIVSLPVSMALHVAPFPQAEEDWVPLRQWSDLDGIGHEPVPHFWVTASSLARLMQQGVPEKYRALLQKSFLLMDEYDHESYRYAGAHGVTSVQEELLLRLGCRRICNMSATPNLETYSTAIARYEEKKRQAIGSPGSQYYQQKIDQLAKRRESLLQSMAHEWRRSLSFEFFGEEDARGQVEKVFLKLSSEAFAKDRKGSVLVEMPRFVLTPDFIDELHGQAEHLFPDGPSAVLLRDSEGHVQAHRHEGGVWKVVPLEDFLLHYSSIEEASRPPVVCFYSQDSVGGDFGLLSNERVVRSQHIVYPGQISPSYAIYQHMRRQRVNVGATLAGEEVPLSKTPITVYLGPEAKSSVSVVTDEERKALPTKDRGGADVDELHKKRFIELAQATADGLYRQEEISRLKTKILRKKEQVVRALLAEDTTSLQRYIDQHFATTEVKQQMLQRLSSCMADVVSRLAMGVDEDVLIARKRMLGDVVERLFAAESGQDIRMQLQLWQAYEALYKIFSRRQAAVAPEPQWPFIAKPPDYWQPIADLMKELYAKNPQPLCVDVLLPMVRQQSRGKDATLHPMPSREVLEKAMLRLRGRRGQEPTLDKKWFPPSGSNIVPTRMIEALIGAETRDSQRACAYLVRLEERNAEALKGREGYVERQKQIKQAREELLRDIRGGVLKCFQKPEKPAARRSVDRALQQARWYEQRLQSYQK